MGGCPRGSRQMSSSVTSLFTLAVSLMVFTAGLHEDLVFSTSLLTFGVTPHSLSAGATGERAAKAGHRAGV